MMEECQNFCKNLKRLREKYGLDEKEMAARLGVGVGVLQKIEQGVVPQTLSCEILVAVFREFGIPPSYQLRELDI